MAAKKKNISPTTPAKTQKSRFQKWAEATLHVELITGADGIISGTKPGSPLEHFEEHPTQSLEELQTIWKSVEADELPLHIGEATATIALSQTPHAAVHALQKTLKHVKHPPKCDGVIGPITKKACWQAHDSKTVALELLHAKQVEYKKEERTKPEEPHLRNWIERNDWMIKSIETRG